jgi:hypothetical protein
VIASYGKAFITSFVKICQKINGTHIETIRAHDDFVSLVCVLNMAKEATNSASVSCSTRTFNVSFIRWLSILLLFTLFKKHFKDLGNILVVKTLCNSLLKACDTVLLRAETVYLEVFIFITMRSTKEVPLWF